LAVLFIVVGLVLATTAWLPWFGTALAVDDTLQSADVALVIEGTGASAPDAAEAWRLQGLIQDVVIVEAPIKTHALVAYWSDLVRWGLASPAPTPADHLHIVRSWSTDAAEQARAAVPALQAVRARSVLVLGGGGIGSRVVARQIGSVFDPLGIGLRMVRYGTPSNRDAAHWYQNAEDRRAVLDSWLQLLVPMLSGAQAGT
jgi:hypothetical protein